MVSSVCVCIAQHIYPMQYKQCTIRICACLFHEETASDPQIAPSLRAPQKMSDGFKVRSSCRIVQMLNLALCGHTAA